jgi:hypothetical protein
MSHTTFSVTDTAPEGSTIGIKIDFTDEDGNPMVPSAITWSLTDRPARGVAATIVNSREDVAVAVPASTVTAVLSGDDLSFLSSEDEEVLVERVFTVEYTYTSTLGSDLPGKAQYIFALERPYILED